MNKQRDSRPPKGFLKLNSLKDVDVLSSRNVGEIALCERCNVKEQVTELGSKLTYFVCKSCRLDNQDWAYRGTDYTAEEMVTQGPDVRLESFYKRTSIKR